MSERVLVNVRFRPQNELEKGRAGAHCVQINGGEEVDVLPIGGQPPKTFTFDHVFDWNATQEDVYAKVGEPVVDSVLKGYNGTILAYGQTGSGKTHTMTGPAGGQELSLTQGSAEFDERGLIPRIVSSLLHGLRKLPSAEISWTVTASVYELYKETLRDLLAAKGEAQPELRIREDRTMGRGVFIENITEVEVATEAEIFNIIKEGMRNKHIASTGANDTSSRSHTLVTLMVTQVNNVQDGSKTVGRLNLVDLAGSERVEKTGAEGDRLKEAQMINLSLTLLGNVIMKLTDGKSLHIPYRDSKLTRILQDSFGGNSRTTLLCNCSPSTYNQAETISTLMFANRAKQIRNKPRINKELNAQELQLAYNRALDEIRMLRDRVAMLEEQLGAKDIPAVRGQVRPSNVTKVAATAASTEAVLSTDRESEMQAQMDDLRVSLRSVMKELEETKEELFERIQEAKTANDRVSFYEKKEAESTQKYQEWKGKYEREKKAADSWMRKFTELSKEKDEWSNRPSSRPNKTAPPKKPEAKRRSSVGRGPSKGPPGGDKAAKEAQLAAPESPVLQEIQDELKAAKVAEAQALLQERVLQEKIEELTAKLEERTAAQEMTEKKRQEGQVIIDTLNQEIERVTNEYEDMLRKQDKEIGELQLKCDGLRGGVKQVDGKLEHENSLLYEQNRDNAQRIVDLTRENDRLERQLKAVQDEKAKLLREIEFANISSDLKQKLLGNKIKATKVAFQQRLLQCFARDDDWDA